MRVQYVMLTESGIPFGKEHFDSDTLNRYAAEGWRIISTTGSPKTGVVVFMERKD